MEKRNANILISHMRKTSEAVTQIKWLLVMWTCIGGVFVVWAIYKYNCFMSAFGK